MSIEAIPKPKRWNFEIEMKIRLQDLCTHKGRGLQSLRKQSFLYGCMAIDFGKMGTIISTDGKVKIRWSYTENAGIAMKILYKKPFRFVETYDTVFDYSEDHCSIHAGYGFDPSALAEFQNKLNKLKEDFHKNNSINVYSEITNIIADSLLKL